MFTCNIESFPIVYFTIHKNPDSLKELDDLYDTWFRLYDRQTYMLYIIDMTAIQTCDMKYILSLVQFSKKIKSYQPWVSCTVFYFKTTTLKSLFEIAIQMESPIRPIILTQEQSVITDILQKQLQYSSLNDYKVYKPKSYTFDNVFETISQIF